MFKTSGTILFDGPQRLDNVSIEKVTFQGNPIIEPCPATVVLNARQPTKHESIEVGPEEYPIGFEVVEDPDAYNSFHHFLEYNILNLEIRDEEVPIASLSSCSVIDRYIPHLLVRRGTWPLYLMVTLKCRLQLLGEW